MGIVDLLCERLCVGAGHGLQGRAIGYERDGSSSGGVCH